MSAQRQPVASPVRIEIRVFGTPAPKGSRRFVGIGKHTGRAILIESSKNERPWSEAVKWATVEARASLPGPVVVEITFTVAKPKSAPKRIRTWPDRRPDCDKLARSTFDALVSAGAIEDDSRVVEFTARKVYPGEHADALHIPGAVIRIFSVQEASNVAR
jgi:Holliday junction resolvase RusA-like endonuclease